MYLQMTFKTGTSWKSYSFLPDADQVTVGNGNNVVCTVADSGIVDDNCLQPLRQHSITTITGTLCYNLNKPVSTVAEITGPKNLGCSSSPDPLR